MPMQTDHSYPPPMEKKKKKKNTNKISQVFLKFYGIRLIFDFRGALLDGDPIMGHWF